MRDYTLEEQYALIALNGQDSMHNTEAKRAAVLGISIAGELQRVLNEDMIDETKKMDSPAFESVFCSMIRKVKGMNKKDRHEVEKEIAGILEARGVLKEIPNLLGCDINYYTADMTMKEYKSDENEYQRIIETLRATVLEPGEIDIETVMLLWIIRESGCIHDIFSIEEQQQIERRQIMLKQSDEIYKIILDAEFHDGIHQGILKLLRWKHKLFKNPYLEGINLLYPFLDRKQAIFIDMVIMGVKVQDRRLAAIDFLRKNGHTCEEIKIGTETIIKVDNGYYRIWPATIRVSNVPIQGIRLLPVYQ